VIENAGSIEELESEVDKLWNELAGDSAATLSASNAP
jgi:hypothetical protein